MIASRFSFAFLILLLAIASARAQDLIETSLRIPTHSAGKQGLEAVMVRPNEPGRHPLALITHGTPRNAGERSGMTPWTFLPHAREFARRGWTTVIVLRRGYGDSGGSYAEDAHACSNRPEYFNSGKEAAKDLREAIAYLSAIPEVDSSRIISVGISTGGFSNVALTADPPPGLLASISFAGGRGSRSPDEVCNPDAIVAAFHDFGKKSRTPMLWVYAENDHYFGPQIAQRFYQAFTEAGGNATFIHANAFRHDGHGLFSLAGIPIWAPLVDDFLKQQNLTLRTTLLSLPTPPDVTPPPQLKPEWHNEFRIFLTLPPQKAYAISPDGHFGYSYGRRTLKEAEKLAVDHCEENSQRNGRCSLVTELSFSNKVK
jgi:dienelactone hydrolase